MEFVPIKFVRVTQLVKLDETWMCPFKPVDSCKLKTSPFVFIGSEFVKASCNLKVLLDVTLKL